MQNTLRDILKSDSTNINIDQLWSSLRQKQHQNALCDLRAELETLSKLPNLAPELKAKVERSLEKITLLIKSIRKVLYKANSFQN